MKTTIIFSLCFFTSNFIQAQEVKPQVVCTSGATMSQGNSKVSFTVGEIVVKTITDGNNSIGQGFTNSAAGSTVTAIQEPEAGVLQMKLYPNPSSNLLFADITESKLPYVQLAVNDINGRQISKDTYAAGNNHIGINTQSWQAGNYFVTVSDTKGKTLGSYKVVKQ